MKVVMCITSFESEYVLHSSISPKVLNCWDERGKGVNNGNGGVARLLTVRKTTIHAARKKLLSQRRPCDDTTGVRENGIYRYNFTPISRLIRQTNEFIERITLNILPAKTIHRVPPIGNWAHLGNEIIHFQEIRFEFGSGLL